MFFYYTVTINILFILFKLNRVWFEKYNSRISFVSYITEETFYSIFHNIIMNFELNPCSQLC